MDYIVENALISLTRRVNVSSNLTNPSDKGAAVSLFRILKDHEIMFDPDEVEIWALRNEWKSKGAKNLRSIAQGILDGKRLQGGKDNWAPDVFNHWKSNEEQV